jgi:dihydrofolate reductase
MRSNRKKMRKVVLYIADSLDGFIARNNGDVSWLFTDADYGYKNFYS